MRFHRFVLPGAYPDAGPFIEYMARVKRHWLSLGWKEVPKADEPAIKAAWIANLESRGVVEVPKPSRCWRNCSIRELGDRADDIEAEFTLKVLAAFRRCTKVGERLLAIDWQHTWYYFDPHQGIAAATRDEWAMPILPDIDSYNYVATDFRFGVLTGYSDCWSIRLFGEDLLAAFAIDPPERFMRLCGPGELRME